LEAGLTHKLTLISAPAGFGKTTLVSEWLRHRTAPAAWISLDEGDNTLNRFVTYLVAALQTLHADIGASIEAMLQSSPPSSTESLMTVVLNDIVTAPAETDSVQHPFILVLDDYQLIKAQAVHQAVAFLLEHMPPPENGLHLIVISRTEPPLPLSRLRVRGQLTELDPIDLRFSLDETTELLNQVMGLGLSDQDVAVLDSRTEGWIAGLRLASLALQGTRAKQGTQALPGFVKAFAGSHRHVIDFLADEVLDRQSEQIQTFLLQTSILDYLTSDLCDAVCGRSQTNLSEPTGQHPESSQATLETLDRANLFLMPLDEERLWYRYHPLFSGFLRHRLVQQMPEQLPILHSRACEWYAQSGRVYEAMGHALSAGDIDRAARLVEETDSATMILRGEATTLVKWLDALPDEVVRSRPRLSISRAWASMILAEVEAIEPHLQDALHALGIEVEDPARWPDSLPTEVEGILGEVAALRAFVAICRGNPHRAIELALQSLSRLPSDYHLVRGGVGSMLGDAYRQTDNVTVASDAYTEALVNCQLAGNLPTAMIITNDLAQLHAVQGQLHRAADLYKQVLEWGAGRHRSRYPAERATMGLGELFREWNELEEAEQYLREGIEQCELGGYARYLIFGYTSLARVRAALGDAIAAAELLQEAAKVANTTGVSRYASQVDAHRVRLWLSSPGSSQTGAREWAQVCGLSAEDQPTYLRETEYLTLARVLITIGRDEGDPDLLSSATMLLERLRLAAESGGRLGSLIEVLVLLSLSLQAQGKTGKAVAVLERALALAEPQNYVRIFVDEGIPMATLLRQTAAQGVLLDYVARLLSAFGDPAAPGLSSNQQLVDPLTDREQEVLRLLAVGLSNREIALELSISTNTVKTHVRRIYSKLDVSNRTQAAARAREHSLL
jgi:LuxR family maltose regulon positive regulatory protein